jgi:nucleoside-diphosphate-sugar epimerase
MDAATTLIAEGLRGKRIVVTGGTGFIGGRLVEQLVNDYAMRPVVLVRSRPRDGWLSRMGAAVELANAAITDEAAVSAALKGCNVVFHCAYDWVNPAANVQGARNLIEACLSNGARLVHVSTFAIYEPFPDQTLTEDAPAKGGGSAYPYSVNKLEIDTEIIGAVGSRGLDAVILMPTIVYGANGGIWTRESVRRLLTGTVILPGAGDGLCNAVHVDDVCQALLLAAVVPAAQGRRYFVSATAPVTWLAFFESYAEIVGCPRPRCATQVPGQSESKTLTTSQIAAESKPETLSARARVKRLLTNPLKTVARSALTRRIAKWMLARLGDKANSWAKRLYYRHAAPVVVHSLDGTLYSAKCHIVIDKIVRELGYAPVYDLERGMAETAAWIRSNFRDEIAAIDNRQR